jgi:hypothetical protein
MKISVELPKRSQKLSCFLCVELIPSPITAPAAGPPAHAQRRHPDRAFVHRAGQAKPAPEVALVPVAPAVAQALAAATGRLGVMPFSDDAFRANA